MSAPDRLRPDRLRAALVGLTVGSEIVVLEETASTNDVIGEMAKDGRPEGLVVFAEHQTAGRGQRGNKWESPAYQGLWLSILLRTEIEVGNSARLTTWAAKTVAATLATTFSLPALVKLPNDIYIFERKVAGVLVELRAQPRAAYIAILGIGINVNQTVDDFPRELQDRATSLAIATGSTQDRTELAVALLQNLDRTYGEVTN
jgi:BirA family transcriptional regulator, biotin operon repressor / biotin---[acetyl-CoA-carboxylase] ligase